MTFSKFVSIEQFIWCPSTICSILEGYTSISVREPLAEIIAQTKELNKKKRELDPHYSTVSDDSGEVFVFINCLILTSCIFFEFTHYFIFR